MPSLKEHLKASERLLGTKNPLVHQILDFPKPVREHRYRHNPSTVLLIKELLGDEAKKEAWLHLFLDWGIVDKYDFKKCGRRK